MVEAIEHEWGSVERLGTRRRHLLSRAHEALALLAEIEEEL
jgi:hypothetical protein